MTERQGSNRLDPPVRDKDHVSTMKDAQKLAGFVHRFVPGEPGGAEVTLLLLHGTGGDEDALIPFARALAPRTAMLSPRGKVLERGTPRFFRRHAPGVLDVEDLKERTHELADFVEEASVAYGFDLGKVVAVGYSNGANIAASLLLLCPGLLAGAVLLRPMVPFEPEVMPDLSRVPVLIAAGESDQMVPVAQPERLAQLLRKAGAEVDLRRHPGGHGLHREELKEVQEWLLRWMPHPRPVSWAQEGGPARSPHEY